MENSYYGMPPRQLGTFPITCDEAMYFLYLPISLPGEMYRFYPNMPESLRRFHPLVNAVYQDCPEQFEAGYVYITVKHMPVSPTNSANRLGWHSDGYLSDDLNYVWYDALPTIFNLSAFHPSPDHVASLAEFTAQALPENDVTYPPHTLLRLDQYNIHRVAEADRAMWRTFVKISVSTTRYNLKGNSHNYLLDYAWPMVEREPTRNHPNKAEATMV